MGPAERAELVARFPEAYARPRPQTLHQLAFRLLVGVRADASVLTRREVQVLEAAVALTGISTGWHEPVACSREALERLFGVGETVTAERFQEVLDALAGRVLALTDDARLVLHPGVPELFQAPLGRRHRDTHAQRPRKAPLSLARVVPRTRPVGEMQRAGGAAAAAAAALQRIDRLLELFAEPSWPALKQGGISIQAVRRLVRLLHIPEGEVRLWLHLAAELDLIAAEHGRWTPTKQAAAWKTAEPAARLADLGRALLGMNALPLAPVTDPDRPGKAAATLSSDAHVYRAYAIRHTVLRVLAELPDGHGVVDDEQLAAAVYDRTPTVFAPYGHRPPLVDDTFCSHMSIWCTSSLEADTVTAAVLRESELLALTAAGALTGLGRALLDGNDAPQLLHAAAALLPLQETAAILADHLVLVTGVPTPALRATLADLCDLERTEAQSQTWRVSPTSVRAFFDRHPDASAEEVLERLTAVSSTPIPQTIIYLVHDTRRRHGHIRLSRAVTVLDVQDEALATELAHHRDLRVLGLRRVGPTVLLSTVGSTRVMSALHAAGYAPSSSAEAAAVPSLDGPSAAGEEAYRAPLNVRFPRQEAKRPRDFARWVAALPADTEPPPELPLVWHIRKVAPQLGAADCTALAEAITSGGRVHVAYRAYGRSHDTLTVKAPRLEGNRLAGERRSHPMPLSLADLRMVLPLPAPRGRL
ncbi:helicase-associated domain-containing protein [Streptomyces sp. NPDC049577]|uniref:helicase-associated domain-containing protein n=1 Tax=Streptomyces sp. NPDC049577 TaxID=3155153 RepID=UPI0034409648